MRINDLYVFSKASLIHYIVFASFILLSSFETAAQNNRFFQDRTILQSPLGMNAHLLFSCSNQYMDELCESMSKAGVKIVRLDLYWSITNIASHQNLCDRAIYYIQKHGMEALINMPQIPIKKSKISLDDWADLINYYAKRYDGSIIIKPNEKEKAIPLTVRYFEIMNEPDLQEQNGLTVEDCFKFIKISSAAVRKARQNTAFVVLPGLCKKNDFDKKLLSLIDNDGKTIADYIDILNFHFYVNNQDLLYETLSKWKELLKSNSILESKPIWVTEYGHTLWDFTEEKQAELLTIQTLTSLAMGFDKVFYYQFHQYGGNFFGDRSQREDFFGILDTSIDNSYGSIIRNDGTFLHALSQGDGSRRIYISDKSQNLFSLYTLTDSMCAELKRHGVAIGGKGYTIDSVVLENNNGKRDKIFSGHYVLPYSNTIKYLLLSRELFSDVDCSMKLLVHISDVINISNSWSGEKPLKGYFAYKELAKKLRNATRPVWIDGLDIKGVSWKDHSNWYYAFWNTRNDTTHMRIDKAKKNIKCQDYLGHNLKVTNGCFTVGNTVVYVISPKDINFKKEYR